METVAPRCADWSAACFGPHIWFSSDSRRSAEPNQRHVSRAGGRREPASRDRSGQVLVARGDERTR